MGKFGKRKFSVKRIILSPPREYHTQKRQWERSLGPSPWGRIGANKFSWKKLLLGG